MTTVRASVIGTFRRASHALATQLYIGVAGRPLLPGGPLTHRVGPLGTVRSVIALRVIDLRLGIRPRARDRRRQPAGLDRPEPAAVREVRHVDDREHHDERAED